MKALRIATILPLLMLTAGVLWAATQYGEATIEQGSMTIVREGQTLKFDQVNRSIPVNEEDLIRVRPESQVELKSRENATMTLGSNAVFQVRPWRSRDSSGFVRALFGRFRATVVGLSGGEQFNVKTATATIGVKGTEYHSQVTSRGGTLLIVTDNVVGLRGQRGPEQDVGRGLLSLTLGINPATPRSPVPPGVQQQFGRQNLGSPSPNSSEARDFAGQQSLIDAGVVSQEQVRENQGDSAPAGTPPAPPAPPPAPTIDPNAGADAARRARVPLQFSR